MTRQKQIDRIGELLRRQHHNISTLGQGKEIPESLGHNGEWAEIAVYMIYGFSREIKSELGFETVQLGRGGASLCVDAYQHPGNGHHTLSNIVGWYEDGTGLKIHVDEAAIEALSDKEAAGLVKRLERYEDRVRELMTAFYAECKYQDAAGYMIPTAEERTAALHAEIGQLKKTVAQRNRQIKHLRDAMERASR